MRIIGPTLLLALAASSLPAQRLEDTRVAVSLASNEMAPVQHAALVVAPSRTSASTGSMMLGGLIGGAMGAFGGGAAGISMANCAPGSDDIDFCRVGGALVGALIGEAIGLPIGVNYAANGRGTLVKSIPTSVGISAVCLVAAFATGGLSVLMIPPLQLYTAIRAERTGKTGFLGW